MKSKTFPMLIFVLILVSCSPERSVPIIPTKTVAPAATFTPAPTLPPTLTPIPTLAQMQITPTVLYMPIELSPEDMEAYQKALRDIPVYRQGDIQLIIQDETGNPLSGHQVKYHQTSHDFLFGGISNNFDAGKQMDAGLNTWSVYMAWNWLEPEYGKFNLDFTNYWLGIDELKNGSMTVRANALYDMGGLPPYYNNVSFDEFLKRLYEHESTTVKRFAPSVDYWEAVLEPNFGNHNPLNLSKDEYYQAISTSIQAIRDNDPTATVEINFSYPCGGIDWLDNFQLLQEMLDRNIDFDTLGLQFYYNAYINAGKYQMTKMSLSEMSVCYDKYETMLAPYGKRVVGSEFSVPSESLAGQTGYWDIPWSEDTQAQYLETAYTIFFSKPSNLGLVWWNTFDPSPFVYRGGLVKEDGTPKKSYMVLRHLIDGWTTSGEGVTDANGTMAFRGYGGEYEVEIINPVNSERMNIHVHATEQLSKSETIQFVPNNLLMEKMTILEKLISYWESKSQPDLVQKGKDYLALVEHHIQDLEWNMADQTVNAALSDLSIQTEMNIPIRELVPVDYPYVENGSAVIWGSTTLHVPYDFPAGIVTVKIMVHSQSEEGEFPIMVSGVGAHYSQLWKVENAQSEVYTYTVTTTGNEQGFTLRFPYDGRIYERIKAQNGTDGELKLYIDEVKLIIKTTEVP